MADKTLYDILEVSRGASPAAIKAAYERLSEAPAGQSESPANAESALRLNAVKDAFLTLGNSARRAAYDRRLDTQWEASAPFWSLSKLAVAIVLALAAGGLYYQHAAEQKRLAAEQEIALAKARQAEEEAVAAAEHERARQQAFETMTAITEARQQREREYALRKFTAEQAAQERNARIYEQRAKSEQQRASAQRDREERQATLTAQQNSAREKAALCQMERQRYGRAISCPY